MRSAVAYLDNGVRVVGDPSFHDDDQMARGNVFYYTKRLLARRFNDQDVQRMLRKEPFGVRVSPSSSQSESATCVFNIQSKGHTSSTVRPEQISAAILSALKHASDQYVEQTVSTIIPPVVVITVPANFTNAQRKATICAAEIAGISSATLINEPTAAAFGHYLSLKTAMPEDAYVMVFDLGGGTLDVTITRMGYNRELWLGSVWRALQQRIALMDDADEKRRAGLVFNNLKTGSLSDQYRAEKDLREYIAIPPKPAFINVMACDGDPHLGGQDFDHALADLVRDRLYVEFLQKRYEGLTRESANRLVFDVMFELRLLRNCEEQKQMFTNRQEVHIGVKINKLTRKNGRPIYPDASEIALLQRPVCMTKMLSKGGLKACEVMLSRNSRNEWTMSWHGMSGLSRFLMSSSSIQLSNVTHVDGGSNSANFKQYVTSKLLPESDLRRVISMTVNDGDKTKIIDFAVTKQSDSDNSTVLNKRWELWLRTLRALSMHYESGGDNDDISYERAANAKFDFEMIKVSRVDFESAARGLLLTAFDVSKNGDVQVSSKSTKSRRKNLWDACLVPIQKALDQAGLRKQDIDEVMLVGGSTRLPKIQSQVRGFFADCPRTRLAFNSRSGEPVKAVAVGAAYYGRAMALSLSESRGNSKVEAIRKKLISSRATCIMTDISSKNIMLKVQRREGNRVLFFTLIRKGEFLPFSHSHVFHPRSRGQRNVVLEIYECAGNYENRYVSLDRDDGEVQKIGELKFDLREMGSKGRVNPKRMSNVRGVARSSPLDRANDTRNLAVCVSFMMDSYGVLMVSARVPERADVGGTARILLNDRMVLTKSQVEAFRTWEIEYVAKEFADRNEHAFTGVDHNTPGF